MPCLDSRSTITRIELQLEDVRSVSIKSIDVEFHRRSGIGVASVSHRVYATGVLPAYKWYKICNTS